MMIVGFSISKTLYNNSSIIENSSRCTRQLNFIFLAVKNNKIRVFY